MQLINTISKSTQHFFSTENKIGGQVNASVKSEPMEDTEHSEDPLSIDVGVSGSNLHIKARDSNGVSSTKTMNNSTSVHLQAADSQDIKPDNLPSKKRKVRKSVQEEIQIDTIKADPEAKDTSYYKEEDCNRESEDTQISAAEAWLGLRRYSDSLGDMLLYQCGICRKRVERLTDHLDQEHEMTIREYSATHPGPAMDTSSMQHR